jgi:hypothetical protein
MSKENRVKATRIAAFVLLAGVLVNAAGCIGISGPSKRCYVPTLGSELQDLKAAQASGAVTDDEYERLKVKLVNEHRYPAKARCK